MKSKILLGLMAAVSLCAIALAQDLAGRAIRYRAGTRLTLDTTSSIADEDGAWTIGNSKLSYLSGLSSSAMVIAGTTNQIVFGATNTAPASTNVILYVSVQIAGDTNAYRLGLTK